jgi:hypothetical protein
VPHLSVLLVAMSTSQHTQLDLTAKKNSVKVSCHCGAVRLEAGHKPEYLNICQCSICRRYGAQLGYYNFHEIQFLSPALDKQTQGSKTAGLDLPGTKAYIWGDKGIAFIFCVTCGCVGQSPWLGLLG